MVTLVKCWGLLLAQWGSMAAIREDGAIVGSVSGGCIEKELTSLLRKDGQTSLIRHEVSTDQAVRYGLPCGGSLELVFEQLSDSSQIKEIITALRSRRRICRSVNLSTGAANLVESTNEQRFSFDGKVLNKLFGPSWRNAYHRRRRIVSICCRNGSGTRLRCDRMRAQGAFFQTWKVKGVPIHSSLPDDAVKELATDCQSAVLALTHDPNLDDLALIEALTSDAFYVGALGSRKNNERRRKRLVDMFDISVANVDRLHGPIGLDIGSKTPAEIAISILAQITDIRRKFDFQHQDSEI